MASRPRQRKIPDDEWARYKDIILDLYLAQDLDLRALGQRMKDEQGFIASPAQFEAQLKVWDARKNLKVDEWKVLLDDLDKIPRSTARRIMISGRQVSEKTINRARKHVRSTFTRMSRDPSSILSFQGDLSISNIKQVKVETQKSDGRWALYKEMNNIGMPSPNEQSPHSTENVPQRPITQELTRPSPSPLKLFTSPPQEFDLSNFDLHTAETDLSNHGGNNIIPFNPAGLGSSATSNNGFLSPFCHPFGFDSTGSDIVLSPILNKPFTMSMGFIWNWLFDLPSVQFECHLTLGGTDTVDQVVNSRQQNLIPTSQGSVDSFLRTISNYVLHHRGNGDELVPLQTRRSVWKLSTLLPGQSLQPEHDQNLDLISIDEIVDSQFYRLLICSMINGLASLGDIPVESIIKFLGRSGNMKLQFLKFLQTCPGHAAKAFAETLFRAAIEASDNHVIIGLLETNLIDINMALWHHGRKYSPMGRAIKLLNPAGANILLNAGASTAFNAEANPRSIEIEDNINSLLGYVLYVQHNDKNSDLSEWLRLVENIVKNRAHLDLVDLQGLSLLIYETIRYRRPFTFRSDLWYLVFSACPSSMHADFFANNCFRALAIVLQDNQATEIARCILAECEKSHCNRCIGEYRANVNDGILVAAQQGHYNLVHLLLPHTSLLLSVVFCSSIRSRNNALINDIMSARPDINAIVTLGSADSTYPFKNSNVTVQNPHFQTTPFAEAIKARNSSLIRTFEQAGILDSLHDETRADIAIKEAVAADDFDYVRKLLAYASSPSVEHLSYALNKATQLNNENLVLEFSEAGARLSARIKHLYVALRNQNARIVRILLNADIWMDIHSMEWEKEMELLDIAIDWGDKSIIMDLLSTFDFPGRFSLHLDDRIFKEMSKSSESSSESSESSSESSESSSESSESSSESSKAGCSKYARVPNAIYRALGDPEMLQFLLESKLATQEKLTESLMIALHREDSAKLQHLLDLGADGSDQDIWRIAATWRPHMLPFLTTDLAHKRTILTKGMRTNVIKGVIRHGVGVDYAVDHLIASGTVDLGDTGQYDHDFESRFYGARHSPLGLAIMKCADSKVHIVNALLQAKCDPNSIVNWFTSRGVLCTNQTALLEAIDTEMMDLIKLLIDRGARVNNPARFAVKRTPLQKAAELGNFEIVRLLIEHGADVNGEPAFSSGGTALQLAAITGNCNIAAELLERGAFLHAPPSRVHGRWPLEGAAEHGRLDMIQFLWNVNNDTHTVGLNETGFEEKHCRKAMQRAVDNGHIACKDLISELSGFTYEPPVVRQVTPIYVDWSSGGIS